MAAEQKVYVLDTQPLIGSSLALMLQAKSPFVATLLNPTVDDIYAVDFEPQAVLLLNCSASTLPMHLEWCAALKQSTCAHGYVVLLVDRVLFQDDSVMIQAFRAAADGVLERDTLTLKHLTQAVRRLLHHQSLWNPRQLQQRMLGQQPQTAARPHGEQLTAREHQIMACVCAGLTNQAIADQLQISKRTVESHMSRIFAKLAVHSRAEALAVYYELNEQAVA